MAIKVGMVKLMMLYTHTHSSSDRLRENLEYFPMGLLLLLFIIMKILFGD